MPTKWINATPLLDQSLDLGAVRQADGAIIPKWRLTGRMYVRHGLEVIPWTYEIVEKAPTAAPEELLRAFSIEHIKKGYGLLAAIISDEYPGTAPEEVAQYVDVTGMVTALAFIAGLLGATSPATPATQGAMTRKNSNGSARPIKRLTSST